MPQEIIDQHQRSNFFQTALLLFAMTFVLCAAGGLMYGLQGMAIAFGLLIFGVFFSRRVSTAMLLRHYQAQPISRHDAPGLIEIMDSICAAGNIETPPLYYIPTKLPNAFAAGTGKKSFVAVTDGLLRLLNRRELAGVLAHEVSHILNRDVQVLGIADTITRTTSMFSRIGLMMVLFSFSGPMVGMSLGRFLLGGLVLFVAPAVMVMLQLAISRTREFDADLGAAELTGDPVGLAMALQKIMPPQPKGILGKILEPGPHRTQPAMLRTHPPTEERVERLQELAEQKRRQDEAKARQAAKGTEQRVSTSLQGIFNEDDDVFVIEVNHPEVDRRPRYHPTNGMWY